MKIANVLKFITGRLKFSIMMFTLFLCFGGMRQTLSASTLATVSKQFTIEGDSTSVGYGLSGYIEGPPEIYGLERWGAKLDEMLDDTWVVRTVAKGGDGFFGSIPSDRVREIKSNRKPSYERDIVLVWAGTNDIYGLPYRGISANKPLAVYDAMKSYVAALKADGFEVWIMSAYPRSAFGFADKNAERIAFNNMLRADSSFADKFLDIDAWTEFRTNMSLTYYQTDRAHMSGEGNMVVARRVYAELVTSPLSISSPAALKQGQAGKMYSEKLTSSGGNGKPVFSLVKGKLPTGLKLINDSIEGTPTQKGAFKFTMKVRDDLGTSINREMSVIVS